MNLEGVWHSICFFRPWRISCAWTKRSHGWICVDAKLVMMPSRPGGDGTQGSDEHRSDRTGGVSFQDQCEGRLLTENLDSSYLWDIHASQVTSSLEFESFLQYVECVLQKTYGFCFATSHPPVICLTLCLHLFHLCRNRLLDSFASITSDLLAWTVFSRIMTLFLKMEVVIVLGKSILVGRSCRLDKIVLFDFFENQISENPLSSVWGEIW